MTAFATLALGAAMAWVAPQGAEAAAAIGERTVSGVRISLGEEGRRWTLVPTMLDGKVESFLALREDMAYGENLTAVWYRKSTSADGTESWEPKAFPDQDQSKAIRAVKDALALADATDGSWPAPVAPVAAAAPESLVKGVLETDALAPLVADLEDPQPLVEMLEGAGWKAAWIGPLEGGQLATAEPDAVACSQDVVLAALATTVEVVSDSGIEAGMLAGAQAMASCGCYPGWEVLVENNWGNWTCTGPWTLYDSTTGTGGLVYCWYERPVKRTQMRQLGYYNSSCQIVAFRTETRTETSRKVCSCEHTAIPPTPCPAAPSASCTDIPSDCNASAGQDSEIGDWQ